MDRPHQTCSFAFLIGLAGASPLTEKEKLVVWGKRGSFYTPNLYRFRRGSFGENGVHEAAAAVNSIRQLFQMVPSVLR